jgi:hypothetical protein
MKIKNTISSVLLTALTVTAMPTLAVDHDHSHESLFSQNDAMMAAGAVETVNNYCEEIGAMPSDFVTKSSTIMRETIEGLSLEELGEEFTFSESHEKYIEGQNIGRKLISEAEDTGHVTQMCTVPDELISR